MKQIQDEKNNLSIIEKIDQFRNLITCMKRKIEVINQVESNKRQEKNNKKLKNSDYDNNFDSNITIKHQNYENFEII